MAPCSPGCSLISTHRRGAAAVGVGRGGNIPLWAASLHGQHPDPAPRRGDAAEKPKEQDTDQARRAEAQRCRKRGKTRKEVVDFDFQIFSYPSAPRGTLMQEVFQARLRHCRSCLCFQNRLGFLPTAFSTSTWCQMIEKKTLEQMNRDKLSCTTTERRHRSMKHQPQHMIHFYLQS